MPAELEPPALSQLVAFAERSRVGDWSLRSALVRYAQGQPQRVSDLLEVVRRIEAALHAHDKVLGRRGPVIWSAVEEGSPLADPTEEVVRGLLRTIVPIDEAADALAAWAVDRSGQRPDDLVDAVTAEATRRLDALGVPREERTGPPPRRRR
jgi:hypothetical protein